MEHFHNAVNEFFVGLAAVQLYRQDNVFIHVQHWHKVVVLENKADLPAAKNRKLVGGHSRNFPAVYFNAARGRVVKPAHHVQQRGLAAARCPHNRNKFPALNGKINAVQSLDKTVAAAVIFF